MLTRRTLPLAALAVAALVACQAQPPVTTTTTTTVPAGEVRALMFPVEGKVRFGDSFGAPRSGGRTHEGADVFGPKMARLVAAAEGVVTWVRHDNSGLSGNALAITDAEGWRYVYIHLNNDTPGTDDGANRFEEAFAAGIAKGVRVRAGQHVGFLGDSGNAEETEPHLHFELHRPDGVIINPYASLVAAR